MKEILFIFLASSAQWFGFCLAQFPNSYASFDFWGDTVTIPVHTSLNVAFDDTLCPKNIQRFHTAINASQYQQIVATLEQYRSEKKLDDWFYYQLIRFTAEQLAPKATNYQRYTLMKWFLLVKSGYNARITLFNGQLLLYVQSNDEIFDIPFYTSEGKNYVCLNVHDYQNTRPQSGNTVSAVTLHEPQATTPFSYRILQLPNFRPSQYNAKTLQFLHEDRIQRFAVQLNPRIKQLFTNYPVVDFEAYFNIPMSSITYNSLIPLLRKNLAKLATAQGVDYLMQFTRHAFSYENDQTNFGKEKRMGAEETLLSSFSDCDDRAALFFYLVKEIYNLPMLAIKLPTHITIAVQFALPFGETINYKGERYSICDPTPQVENSAIGKLPLKWKDTPFEVVYAYRPN